MVYKKLSEAHETCYGSVMKMLSVNDTERYQYANQEKF